MCPDFRRGAEAVAKAQEKSKGGGYSPFAPEIFWSGDGDERYLLFLNSMTDIPTVEMIEFIPVKRKRGDGTTFDMFERVIARTDPAIGDASDPMADEWEGKPKDRCVAVAVELEPTLEDRNGRMRPVGFQIKTSTYERRIVDDEGNLTEEREEVTTPAIGFVHASPHNFFNVVAAYDSTESEIERTPLKITRVGGDKSTTYTVTGYPDQTVDLAPLIEEIDGVSYLSQEERDDLIAQIDDAEGDDPMSDEDGALLVGSVMLDKRLEELSDPERYDKLFGTITASLDRFGTKKSKGKSSSRKATSARPTRRPTRRSAEPTVEETEDVKADVEAEPAAKPARRSRAKKAASEPEPAAKDEITGKLDKLRKRAQDAKQAVEA